MCLFVCLSIYSFIYLFIFSHQRDVHASFILSWNQIERLSMKNRLNLFQYDIFKTFPKEFADDNCKFNENDKMSSNGLENIGGKGEIAYYEQFLLFPQCFLNTITTDT